MTITRVWLDETDDECTSCGACESVCPDVFEIPDKMVVIDGVDFSKYEECIKDAADGCPTAVIKYEEA